jgi:hypothetical protein
MSYSEYDREYHFTSVTLRSDFARFERKADKPGLFAMEFELRSDGTLSIVKLIGVHDGKPPAQTVYQRFQRLSVTP